jgi:hypothetical protein
LRVIYEPNSFIKQDSGINLRRSQHHVPYPSLEFGIILGGTRVSVCCPRERNVFSFQFFLFDTINVVKNHSPAAANQVVLQKNKKRKNFTYYPQSHPLKSNNEASTEASPAETHSNLNRNQSNCPSSGLQKNKKRILHTTHGPTHSN